MKRARVAILRCCLLAGLIALGGCGEGDAGAASEEIEEQAEDAADEIQEQTEDAAGEDE